MRTRDRRSVGPACCEPSVTASWKQQVEGPGQGHGPSALAPPAVPCRLSHCTAVPGVLICPVAPWSLLGMSGWPGGPGMAVIDNHVATASVVSDGQSWRLGLAKSDLEQSVCVYVFLCLRGCVGEGDTDKSGLTSPSSARRQWCRLPRIVRRGASMGGCSRQALSGWLCPHLTPTRNSSLPPPGTRPCF